MFRSMILFISSHKRGPPCQNLPIATLPWIFSCSFCDTYFFTGFVSLISNIPSSTFLIYLTLFRLVLSWFVGSMTKFYVIIVTNLQKCVKISLSLFEIKEHERYSDQNFDKIFHWNWKFKNLLLCTATYGNQGGSHENQ